ncbi:MAG: restriction endonuclease subunit S [Thermoproteota archaeon]|nr:restriction endonuclease subunit S [Candidatus Brockarchaeota archaeon]
MMSETDTRAKLVDPKLLYGKLRPYLNKVYVPSNGEGLCTTEFIPFIVVKAKREYVAHYLRTNKVVDFAMSNLTGTRQPHVNIHSPLECPIHLSPIEEQQHIVEYLDQLQKRVETIKKYQEESKGEIEVITQAMFNKAFRGEL